MSLVGRKCKLCGKIVDMLNTVNGECDKTEDGLHIVEPYPIPPLLPEKPVMGEDVLMKRPNCTDEDIPVVRPTRTEAEDAVRTLLRLVGRDTYKDEGVKQTPRRVVDSLSNMTGGQYSKPEKVLGTVFEETGCDEMVICQGIPFSSLCEHHILPFVGTVDIGYLPSKVYEEWVDDSVPSNALTETTGVSKYRIVGLSKLARLVDCFSQRLQVQERMTHQIADALMTCLKPQGVGVVVRGEHTCMSCRGVKKSGTTFITSSMLGAFRDEAVVRSEFLTLCHSYKG